MIEDVTFERTRYQPAPVRFEAGTANIADAVGLGAALDYLGRIGIENVTRYERELLAHATQALLTVPGLHLIGTAAHHCAQPIVRHYGHESTIRASLAVYNTCEEIDALITALRSIVERGVQL